MIWTFIDEIMLILWYHKKVFKKQILILVFYSIVLSHNHVFLWIHQLVGVVERCMDSSLVSPDLLACTHALTDQSFEHSKTSKKLAPFADCLVHFCWETCALCQEYRELKKQGFDMGIDIDYYT